MEPMKPMAPMQPMQPMKPMEPMKPMHADGGWWPKNLGQPDSSGSQNNVRYAYFDDAHRLAVDNGGSVTVYDTGSKRINGFGQQQGSATSLRFESSEGPIDLAKLPKAR